MTTISLTCGHPAVVTHDRGERLVGCAVPLCDTSNVIAALPVSHVDYVNRTIDPDAARADVMRTLPNGYLT